MDTSTKVLDISIWRAMELSVVDTKLLHSSMGSRIATNRLLYPISTQVSSMVVGGSMVRALGMALSIPSVLLCQSLSMAWEDTTYLTPRFLCSCTDYKFCAVAQKVAEFYTSEL